MGQLSLELYDADTKKLYEGKEIEGNEFIRDQESLHNKINSRTSLSDEEISRYVLTKEDRDMFNAFKAVAEGEDVKNFKLKDYIASPQAAILLPKIIVGAARRAAEPVYLASKFFKKVKAKTSNMLVMPVIGTMNAHELAEGQAPQVEALDFNLMQGQQFITATKKGIRIQVTDQYINDSQWDLLTYIIEEAGFAMARLKEQLAMVEFSKRGWTVFDNSRRTINPEAGTTGLNYNGSFNNTMSIEDFLDLIIALMNNEKVPTDILMHPLIWTVFARNGLTGYLTGPTDKTSTIEAPNASYKFGPEAVNGRLPFGLTINLSPFIPIDTENRLFDLYAIDRNNIGIQFVQDELKTDEFRDPIADIQNIKMIERYGFGTLDEGRGIVVARNISMAKSYPMVNRIYTTSTPPSGV